jgi:hypothetical protein
MTASFERGCRRVRISHSGRRRGKTHAAGIASEAIDQRGIKDRDERVLGGGVVVPVRESEDCRFVVDICERKSGSMLEGKSMIMLTVEIFLRVVGVIDDERTTKTVAVLRRCGCSLSPDKHSEQEEYHAHR